MAESSSSPLIPQLQGLCKAVPLSFFKDALEAIPHGMDAVLVLFPNDLLRDHHLNRDIQKPFSSRLHLRSHEIRQHLSRTVKDDLLVKRIVALRCNGPISNNGQLRFDSSPLLDQYRKQLSAPFIKQFIFHLLEQEAKIGRVINNRLAEFESFISPSAFGIAEDLIGGIEFSYLNLGLCIIGIPVRMILEDELSIRFFDILIGRMPGHAEDRIIVLSYHGAEL